MFQQDTQYDLTQLQGINNVYIFELRSKGVGLVLEMQRQ